MNAVFSTRWLFCWLVSGVLMALSACGQGSGNFMETSATVALNPAEVVPDNHAAAPPVEDGEVETRTFGVLHSGEATWYRATGKGNCSFDETDNLMLAAINTTDYATAALCGAYIDVSGPNGTVTVRVVDRCPGCKQGGIDLSRQAFAKIAESSAGRVPVTWQIVSGPVSGPVAYHYMDGANRYWMGIQLRNLRWPVATLEIMPNGATDWISVERRMYNYFVYPRPIAPGPLRVRVTSMTGSSLEDKLPEPSGGMLIQGIAQFQ